MFNYHPAIKLTCVLLVCTLLAYVNYLLFTELSFWSVLHSSHILKAGAIVYLFTVLLFADLYWRRRAWLVLIWWITFNLAIVVNISFHYAGYYPPLYVQYAQSGSLLVYSALLISIPEPYPNWFRIYTMANLLVLIPCLVFYFMEIWYWYELTVYVICFLPCLKSMIFFKDDFKPARTALDS